MSPDFSAQRSRLNFYDAVTLGAKLGAGVANGMAGGPGWAKVVAALYGVAMASSSAGVIDLIAG